MRTLLCALLLSTAIVSPALAGQIGVSLANTDTYLTVLRSGIVAAAEKANQPIQIETAEDDVIKQLSQIQNFISAGVDSIIVAAVDSESTVKMTKLASDAGIPIVYVNVQPADLDNLGEKGAFVASDEVESGTLQTKEVCRLLKAAGKTEAQVLVMVGDLGDYAANQRTKDIHDVIETPDCSFMKILEEQTASWDSVKAQDLMTNWIAAGHKPDAVIANNDNMALGAINAMKPVGWDMSTVVVAGIDATQEALAAMKSGDLDVTVFQNAAAQGGGAVDAAIKLAKGEKVETKVWVPFELVTPETLERYTARN